LRVTVGRPLRVGPGDKVVVQARLPAASKLGRLEVFSRQNGSGYSPYVLGVADMMALHGKPQMMKPLMLRLTSGQPIRELVFTADIDGHIRVMQEVDALDEPKARVRLSCPDLGWHKRVYRWVIGWPNLLS
jgi:hypothetical protein